jgi:hypothetical protein
MAAKRIIINKNNGVITAAATWRSNIGSKLAAYHQLKAICHLALSQCQRKRIR